MDPNTQPQPQVPVPEQPKTPEVPPLPTPAAPEIQPTPPPAAPTTVPAAIPQPVTPQVTPSIPQTPQPPGEARPIAAGPVIADDVDVIEKEWVDQTKKIVEATKNDPYVEEEAIEDLQVDYMKKRYGRDVKKDEPDKPAAPTAPPSGSGQ